MRFSSSFLDELRQRVQISDVIGRHITWDQRKSQPARGDYWACCPFHQEKTPSFHADNRRNSYHCFGCGKSGDIFRFLVEHSGLSFPEAVKEIADQAGMALPAPDPKAAKHEKLKRSLIDVMELATRYFQHQLQQSSGGSARSYLQERGLDYEIIETFRIGFAPNDRSGLKQALMQKGVDEEQLKATGLVSHGPDIAVSYDRFRDRIIFPITDPRGRVIAFGGRAMSSNAMAKYLNSPETELFKKRNTLYNLPSAGQAVRKGAIPILVEGYMDVIACTQAGFQGAIAPLGTAITLEQINLVWRLHDQPILCFDGDEAGQKAAYRAADIILPALNPGKSVRFSLLEAGQDPDDILRLHGREALQAYFDTALPLADMVWKRETEGDLFSTPEARAGLEKRIKTIVEQIQDQAVKRHYFDEFNMRLREFFTQKGASANVSGTQLSRRNSSKSRQSGRWNTTSSTRGFHGKADYKDRAPTSSIGAGKSRIATRSMQGIAPREASLILGLLNHPDIIEDHLEMIAELEFRHPQLSEIKQKILDQVAVNSTTDEVNKFTENHISYQDLIEKMSEVIANMNVWWALPSANKLDAETGWTHTAALHNREVSLNRELKIIEDVFAKDPSEGNWQKFLDIQNQIKDIHGTEAHIEGFGTLSGKPASAF